MSADQVTEPETSPRERPRISLVIPAWNEEKYIAPTLESVTRAKRKFETATGERVEVIVVDNASTDRTAEIARGFGCTVVPFDKHQIAAVRNAGARIAQGDIIAFVDADRSIVPEGLFLEIAANLAHKEVFGGGSRFRADRRGVRVGVALVVMRLMMVVSGLGCVLFYLRRSDFEAIGGWNEALYAAEDLDLAWRMRKAAKADGQKLRHLRGRVTVCLRKMDMVPTWALVRMCVRVLLRRDFSRPDDFHRFFYDVDKLR